MFNAAKKMYKARTFMHSPVTAGSNVQLNEMGLQANIKEMITLIV